MWLDVVPHATSDQLERKEQVDGNKKGERTGLDVREPEDKDDCENPDTVEELREKRLQHFTRLK